VVCRRDDQSIDPCLPHHSFWTLLPRRNNNIINIHTEGSLLIVYHPHSFRLFSNLRQHHSCQKKQDCYKIEEKKLASCSVTLLWSTTTTIRPSSITKIIITFAFDKVVWAQQNNTLTAYINIIKIRRLVLRKQWSWHCFHWFFLEGFCLYNHP
jgi:hypothetical protein